MELRNPWRFAERSPAARSGPAFSRPERRELFRTMVVGELGRGALTKPRRRRLVGYAAMLDISAVEAGELIAEARDEVNRLLDAGPALRLNGAADALEPWPVWVKLSLVAAAWALLDAAWLHWVF